MSWGYQFGGILEANDVCIKATINRFIDVYLPLPNKRKKKKKNHWLPKSNVWDIIFCVAFFTRADMTSCYWNAIILTSSTLVWVGNNFFLRECHEDSNLEGFWKQMMCVLRQPSIDVYLCLHPWLHRGQRKDDECLFDHMVLAFLDQMAHIIWIGLISDLCL